MGKHSLLWIILILFCVLGLPAISTPKDIMTRVVQELSMIEGALGKDETAKVTSSATSVYNGLFVETGFVKASRKFLVGEGEKEKSESLFGSSVKTVAARTNDYVIGFSALCYAMLVRLAICLAWLPYIAPFFVAVMVDAAVRRKIKFATFGHASPIRFAAAAHVMIVVVFLPLLYLVVPIPVTPLFVPFWALMSSVPVMTVIANTQRV